MNFNDAFAVIGEAPSGREHPNIWRKLVGLDGLCAAKGLRAFLVTRQNGRMEQLAGGQEGRDRAGFWCDHFRALRSLDFDARIEGEVNRLTDFATKYVDGLGWKGHAYALGGIDVHRLDFVSINDLSAFIVMRFTNHNNAAVEIEISTMGEIGPRYMWPSSDADVRGSENIEGSTARIFDCGHYLVATHFGPKGSNFECDGGKFRAGVSSHIPQNGKGDVIFAALVDFDEVKLGKRAASIASSCASEFRRSAQYYEGQMLAMPTIHTTDSLLNRAIDSAKGVLIELYSDSPVGKGWFAGIPCFSWFFTGDGSLISRAANGVGLWTMAEEHLGTMATFRSERGQIPHELVQIPEVNSRGLKTGYMHISATPLWIIALHDTYMWTANSSFVSRHYPEVRAALGFLSSLDRDGDGLIEAFPEELLIAWDEVTSEGRRGPCVEINALYLHALKCASRMASDLGLAGDAERFLDEARSLESKFVSAFWNPDGGAYYDRIDPTPKTEVAPYQSWPLIMAVSKREHGTSVIDRIQGEGLIGPCGVSIWKYEGGPQEGYYRGSVWPAYTGMVALGAFKYGRMEVGASLLKILMDLTYTSSDPGKINEYYSHDCKERGQFMQGFSSSPVIGLVTEGLMGLEPDAPRSLMTLQPWLPEWLNGIRINGLRIGSSKMNLGYEALGEDRVITIEHEAGQRAMDMPTFIPLGDGSAVKGPNGWEICSTLRGRCAYRRFSPHPGERIVERFSPK